MKKMTITDLIEEYLNPGSSQREFTALVSMRVPTEVKEKLNVLSSVLGLKPSPLAAELFSIALDEAIDSLPFEKAHEFDLIMQQQEGFNNH